MNVQFSQQTLRQDLLALLERKNADGMSDLAGRATCAEVRFESSYTALERAYEAHLARLEDAA